MKLIVGLGNPGKEYEGTRHNVGFETVDLLSSRHRINLRSRRSLSRVGEGHIAGEKVILAKPMTFMNLSGQAVAGLARHYRLDLADMVVICDDVNLPLGRIRIRARGSAGGHNGLKDIIFRLGTEDFPRVRIGIGSPGREMVDHVLSRFRSGELSVIRDAISQAADAVEIMLSEGMDRAMNQFNAPPSE